MKKYLAFFKISLLKSLEYRARAFIWLFWDIGPPLIMMFFWLAVFKENTYVAGYDFFSMMVYYLVIIFARNIVLTHPDEPLQREIYTGQINVYLPRPANLVKIKFIYELAYKFLKFFYLIPIFIICYFLFLKGQTAGFSLNLLRMVFFLLSCSISFCLYFLIKFLVGISSFWFTEIEWFTGFEELALLLFGGTLFPLDLLPLSMQKLSNFLPFKYLFYQPAQGLLGRLSNSQMVLTLIIQIFWLVLFYLLLKRIYKAGLKIYSGFGG